MDLIQLTALGARELAAFSRQGSDVREAAGITAAEWDLLTQSEYWTVEQRRHVRSVLAEVVNLSLTLAGIPPAQMPAQYIAAVICAVVAPANRLVAASRAPEGYDVIKASGLDGAVVVETVERETMVALVLLYSSGKVLDYQGRPIVMDEAHLVEKLADE